LILQTPQAVIGEAARQFVSIAQFSIATRGLFTVALAGGSTPRALYEALAKPPLRDSIDWDKVHVFLGDERAVPPEDKLSNSAMAREALLDRVPLQADHIHLPLGDAEDLEAEARRYEAELLALGASLDLVLLGMGRDGHTASLFPASPALNVTDRFFVATPVASLEPHVRRLTLTLPAINAAQNVLFMVTGEDKATSLAECLQEQAPAPPGPPQPPSRGVKPQGNLFYLVDKAAAQKL
jgi:6-phosphogluconolactonase